MLSHLLCFLIMILQPVEKSENPLLKSEMSVNCKLEKHVLTYKSHLLCTFLLNFVSLTKMGKLIYSLNIFVFFLYFSVKYCIQFQIIRL